jgi:3-hydroxypropanoate dehydrogenase
MSDMLSSEDLDIVFRAARTHNVWLDKPVEDALLERVYDLAKMGPTSANMCPMRIVFVKSPEAKERLKPALDPGNADKTMKAPVTAIIGMDLHFYEQLPKLFPHADAKMWFKDLPDKVLEYIALRNSSLQGAYFMLAARALGLDCGPMSASTTQRLTRRSLRGRRSDPISCATSVTATRANSIRAHRASALRNRARWSDGIARSLSTRRSRSRPTAAVDIPLLVGLMAKLEPTLDLENREPGLLTPRSLF